MRIRYAIRCAVYGFLACRIAVIVIAAKLVSSSVAIDSVLILAVGMAVGSVGSSHIGQTLQVWNDRIYMEKTI
jgi:hypothetical protein